MYVHVPFCKDICAYCDFMRCRYYAPLADKWLQRLRLELHEKHIDPIETLYIGGGTPSALATHQLEALLQMLAGYTKSVQEYTIEVNADSLTDEKIELLSRYGVNRISMGAQTFQNKLLKIIDRKADRNMIVERIDQLHQAGIHNISLDLMYGLPKQSLSMWEDDLRMAVQLPISHISLYSLTIEEHSVFGRTNVQPCSSELEADMYEVAIAILTKHQFEHYEISSFAKAGRRSLHNQMYWHYEDFYGIGCGASGKQQHIRYDNTKNLHTYIQEGCKCEPIVLRKEDEMFELLMMSLRLQEGLSIAEFQNRFQVSIFDVYGNVLQEKLAQGLLLYENGYLHTSKKGMLLLNDVLVDFLP